MRPVVLLDVDGPMAQFTKAFLDALETETGASMSVDQVDCWNIHETQAFKEIAKTRGYGSHTELNRAVAKHVELPGFCFDIEPNADAKPAVEALSEIADVYAVTSPWASSRTWMHERTQWLQVHFGIPRSRVIHAATKHLICGDVFVDDKASHVEAWSKRWPGGLGLLFDMHHNQNEGAGLHRASWPWVVEVVRSLATRGAA